jgi:hypothetical protein
MATDTRGKIPVELIQRGEAPTHPAHPPYIQWFMRRSFNFHRAIRVDGDFIPGVDRLQEF